MYVARYGTVSSGAGSGIELQAVGAAVIGGVAIFGGSGTVWGAAIGGFLLVTINRALPILGISDFWQQAVVGALILAAIVLDRVLTLRQERKLVEARDQLMTAPVLDRPADGPDLRRARAPLVAPRPAHPRGRGDRAAGRWSTPGATSTSRTSTAR